MEPSLSIIFEAQYGGNNLGCQCSSGASKMLQPVAVLSHSMMDHRCLEIDVLDLCFRFEDHALKTDVALSDWCRHSSQLGWHRHGNP